MPGIDQMPEGSFHSEADADKRSVHFDTEEVRNLRFRRRFGYFVAVDKVTRTGVRNIPKQIETRFFRPLPLRGRGALLRRHAASVSLRSAPFGCCRGSRGGALRLLLAFEPQHSSPKVIHQKKKPS